MTAIKERLRPYLDENPVAFKLEKWLQIHAGGNLAPYFNLFRLLHSRGDVRRIVTPNMLLVIEGFPRSGNSFARRAFVMAQNENFDKTRIAHHLHVPAQVVQVARWQIPTLVLIRRPKDAVMSFALWDPISVDQALRYYMETYARNKFGETLWERKVHRPSAVKERIKHEIEYDLENPKREKLIAEAEAVYHPLTNPVRIPAPAGK